MDLKNSHHFTKKISEVDRFLKKKILVDKKENVLKKSQIGTNENKEIDNNQIFFH